MKPIRVAPALASAIPLALLLASVIAPQSACGQAAAPSPRTPPAAAIATVPGMPPVPDPLNLYSETSAAKLSPAVAGDLRRVYVPHLQSNDVWVIDPATSRWSTSSRSG